MPMCIGNSGSRIRLARQPEMARLAQNVALAILSLAMIAVFATAAIAQNTSSDPAAGTGQTKPDAPTGGGPTGGQPAPAPPAEQTVILPSASGHSNSAAPTMNRNCDAVPATTQGSPANADDPCRKPADAKDRQQVPQMSK